MTTNSSANPLGIKCIDHLEFCCDTATPTKSIMEKFGFMNSEIDEKNDQLLISQGQVRFLLNAKKDSYARDYLKSTAKVFPPFLFRWKAVSKHSKKPLIVELKSFVL